MRRLGSAVCNLVFRYLNVFTAIKDTFITCEKQLHLYIVRLKTLLLSATTSAEA